MAKGTQTSVPLPVPAPIGGLNTYSPASQLPPYDAPALENLIGGQNGLLSRLGHQDWITGLVKEVRTIMVFEGLLHSKLFAVTNDGVFDASVSADSPARKLDFGVQGDANGGFGNAINFASAAGNFLLFCDEINGYHLYRDVDDTFVAITQGTGANQVSNVNPQTFCQVAQYGSRVWFVQRGSTCAWYLGLAAIQGAATKFDFGPQFPHGGTLAGLYVYTQDGGSGANDKLIAISTTGDVVMYEGLDPALSTTFQRTGQWYVGRVPAGRRVAISFGGDLLIMSDLGIIPLSTLIAGRSLLSPDVFATGKVRNLFNGFMQDLGGSSGWGMFPHPAESAMIIALPKADANADSQQLVLSLATKGWSTWRGLPLLSSGIWRGLHYFGTPDGRVCLNIGSMDGVARDGTVANADPIVFSGRTAARSPSPTTKQVHMIRASLLTQGVPVAMRTEARYDFDPTPVLAPPPLPKAATAGAGFDLAQFDLGSFDDPAAGIAPKLGAAQTIMSGGTGVGIYVALAFCGQSWGRVNIIGWDLTVEAGGFL